MAADEKAEQETKLAILRTALVEGEASGRSAPFDFNAFFADRKGRGDPAAAIRLLTRRGGQTPRSDDEVPG
jgi:hypothetical protein